MLALTKASDVAAVTKRQGQTETLAATNTRKETRLVTIICLGWGHALNNSVTSVAAATNLLEANPSTSNRRFVAQDI